MADTKCPHCGAPLIEHAATGPKAGAFHCNGCGGCWVKQGGSWVTREGHPAPADWKGG